VDAPGGDGLRLRRHLLAAPARLAAARRLEAAAPRPTEPAGAGGQDRLVEGGGGQPERPRRFGGALTGKNPTDRAKKGSKRHLLVDRRGTPLAVRITGAQRHDSTQLPKLLDEVAPIRRRRGRPRARPQALYGDRAYGTPRNRAALKRRRIEDHLAAPGMPHGSGLGRVRWVVERTLAWVGQARRLKVRYEVSIALHRAFHYLQLARICCKVLDRDF
jgi:transposase